MTFAVVTFLCIKIEPRIHFYSKNYDEIIERLVSMIPNIEQYAMKNFYRVDIGFLGKFGYEETHNLRTFDIWIVEVEVDDINETLNSLQL
jgi:hypothetical protein